MAAASDKVISALGTEMPGVRSNGVRVLAPAAVWPDGVPASDGWLGRVEVPVQEELRDDGNTVWNVTVPSFQAFLPPTGKGTGAAIIIAPGGGFRLLSIRNEGSLVAHWLADHGIAAFVLKYRLVQNLPGETGEQMRDRVNATMKEGIGGAPGVQDGLETLRLLRMHPDRYGIDAKRVGFLGFSAGGHVAGKAALADDPALRPNFVGLIYGMPFDNIRPKLPQANLPYPPGTATEPWLRPTPTRAPGRLPPLFMAMAQDDRLAGAGFRDFYDNLIAQDYFPEVHLYQRGNHGFGMSKRGGTSDYWLQEFLWWMEGEGFTTDWNTLGAGKER